MAKRRAYSDEDKANAVRLALHLGCNLRAGQLLGIPEQNIRRWRQEDGLEQRCREDVDTGLERLVDAAIDAHARNIAKKAYGSPTAAESLAAMRDLWKVRESLKGNPTERVAVSLEDRLAQIRRERGLDNGDEGVDEDGPGETV